MYDKLIKRLRECTVEQNGEKTLWSQAADVIEGLSHAVDQMTEWQKHRWIPVTERLPEEDTNCLIFIVGGEFGQLSWISMAIFYNGVFRYDDHCGEFDQITHWIPLPQPPEVET